MAGARFSRVGLRGVGGEGFAAGLGFGAAGLGFAAAGVGFAAGDAGAGAGSEGLAGADFAAGLAVLL